MRICEMLESTAGRRGERWEKGEGGEKLQEAPNLLTIIAQYMSLSPFGGWGGVCVWMTESSQLSYVINAHAAQISGY